MIKCHERHYGLSRVGGREGGVKFKLELVLEDRITVYLNYNLCFKLVGFSFQTKIMLSQL